MRICLCVSLYLLRLSGEEERPPAEALWLAPEAAALAATPHQVRAGPAEDAAVTLRAARVNVAMTAALSLLLAAVASPLVDRVYGPASLPAAPALWALVPGIVAMGAVASSGSYVLSAAVFVIWVTRAAGQPFHEGWCPTAADARWVLDLLADHFLRGRKDATVT